MFNPIYQKDGSLSFFRIACLFVAVSCFICGCVMKVDSSDKNEQILTRAEQVEQNADVVESDDNLSSDEIRSLALNELATDSEYMQICGTIDRVYDSCSVQISENLKPYYSLEFNASADGFKLVLKATEANTDDCSIYESNSNGDLFALNKSGSLDKNCLKGLGKDKDKFFVIRDTDTKQGEMAPSGFTPIVKNLTQR